MLSFIARYLCFFLELEDKEQKIAALNVLVHMLPKPNLALISALSQFLIQIVDNADVNKMTLRNVGIVFVRHYICPGRSGCGVGGVGGIVGKLRVLSLCVNDGKLVRAHRL